MSIQYTHTNICTMISNTLGLCLQTCETLWFTEHLSSMTSHSKAFGGPPVLIKTRTSFSTQLWQNLRPPQLDAEQHVILVVTEVTQFQRNKVTQEAFSPPKVTMSHFFTSLSLCHYTSAYPMTMLY